MEKKIEDYLRYQPETGEIFWCAPRKKIVVGQLAGCVHQVTGYRYICFNSKHYPAHRVAWRLYYGEWPDKGLQVDHKNQDKTDNRILNLRLSTKSQNGFNTSKLRQSNTSGFKGVWFDKRRNVYSAEITVRRKKKFLGYFKTPEEASEAYKYAAKQYHGDFYAK